MSARRTSFSSGGAVRGGVAALCLLALLASSGCNGGVIALALLLGLEDGGGGGGGAGILPAGGVTIRLESVEGARSMPERVRLRVRLEAANAVETALTLSVAAPGEPFRPATLLGPFAGPFAGPGTLEGLEATPDGAVHEIFWNAAQDTGGDRQQVVTLRLEAEAGGSTEITVVVGNDPPVIVEVRCEVLEDTGDVKITAAVTDSAGDPTEVEVAVGRSGAGADEELVPARIEPLNVAMVSDGEPPVTFHELLWRASEDRAVTGRRPLLRITALDFVEGVPGKSSDPFLKELCLPNAPPAVRILETPAPDARPGFPLLLEVSDPDSDPVDVIVQWTFEGETPPELTPELTSDPELRDVLLEDPVARRGLRIISHLPRAIEGRVEAPVPELELAAGEILATWILTEPELTGVPGLTVPRDEGGGAGVADPSESEAQVPLPETVLPGRPVEILRADGSRARSVAAAYDSARGVLRLDPPPDPPPAPGDRVRIELGSPLRFSSPPEGALHRVFWNLADDIPAGGRIVFRAVAYDRPAGPGDCVPEPAGSPAPSVLGPVEVPAPFDLRPPRKLSPDLRGQEGIGGAVARDIDGDGRVDVALAARVPNGLLLFLQTAPGAYDFLRLEDGRIGPPSAITAGDFDGDGDLDLAIAFEPFTRPEIPEFGVPAQSKPGGVILYRQGPDLDFIADRVVLTADGVEPVALAAGDLDRDGDLDLVALDGGQGAATLDVWYAGGCPAGASCTEAGEGYFRARAGGAPSNLFASLALHDFDRDGTLDIVAGGGGGLLIFPNDGRGVFGIPEAVSLPGTSIVSLVPFDRDGDGEPELLAADAAGGGLYVIEQTADGPAAPEPLAIPGIPKPGSILVLDADGNGLDDVLLAGVEGGAFVGLRAPDGSFSSAAVASLGGVSAESFFAGDLDGDGSADLGGVDSVQGSVLIAHQDGAGLFSRQPEMLSSPEPRPWGLVAADFDGDGLPDAIASASPGIAAADLDGDGRRDLIEAEFALGEVRADLAAGAPVVAGTFAGPAALAVRDFDGDGRLEVAVAARFADEIAVLDEPLRRDGPIRTALAVEDGAVFSEPIALEAADLDGDGRTDLVALAHLSAEVVVFPREADGFLAGRAAPLGADSLPVALAVLDADGDGDADLVAGGAGSVPLALLVQGKRFAFSEPRAVPVPPDLEITALRAADLDGDGRADLAGAAVGRSNARPAILLYLTKGGGGALARPPRLLRFDALRAPVSLLALDLDADGARDLLAADRGAGRIFFLRGGR